MNIKEFISQIKLTNEEKNALEEIVFFYVLEDYEIIIEWLLYKIGKRERPVLDFEED